MVTHTTIIQTYIHRWDHPNNGMGGESHIKQPSQHITVGEHSANTSRKHVIIAIKQLRARVWRWVCVCVWGGAGGGWGVQHINTHTNVKIAGLTTTLNHAYQLDMRGQRQRLNKHMWVGGNTTLRRTYNTYTATTALIRIYQNTWLIKRVARLNTHIHTPNA